MLNVAKDLDNTTTDQVMRVKYEVCVCVCVCNFSHLTWVQPICRLRIVDVRGEGFGPMSAERK